MNMPLVCTSKIHGPSCLMNLGRVGMGQLLCGPSFMWAELVLGRVFRNSSWEGGGGVLVTCFFHY